MLFLNLHFYGLVVDEMLFGLWLLPLALLVYRVAIPSGVPRRLAYHRRLGLGDPEPYWGTVAAILRQAVYLLSARLLRGGGVHAMARYQGRQPSTAAVGSVILGRWLGCTS